MTTRRLFVFVWPAIFASAFVFHAISCAGGGAVSKGGGSLSSTDWPWWRGPGRDGIARADQEPPLTWSATKNVLWKSAIPGRGHGSPTVVGDRVVVATADEALEVQAVLCYDRASGKRLWKTDVHRGALEKKGNRRASQASSTVASDGERFFINFLNDGAVYTTALSLAGDELWETKISDYVTHQGYGSSPAVYGALVIVSADNKGGGAVCGLERATGKEVWRLERPKEPNYPSPTIFTIDGRDQLLLTGCNLVTSLDPLTGRKLWEAPGATTECVTTTVTDGDLVFTSGGYPKNHVSAMRADGSGEVLWENTVRVYVPSMLVHESHLFAVTDAGIATCWKSSSGEPAWRARLGGTFNASPVRVGELIFATNEEGKTFIFKADPAAFELVGENHLGEEVYATPTYVGGRIYMRVAAYDGDVRAETLYCIADGASP